MNLDTSTTDKGDELEEKSIVGEWTFKTYIFNANKLISLKSTTSVTCTATEFECTEINLTGLTYRESTSIYDTNLHTWSGSQGGHTAEVVSLLTKNSYRL